MIVRVVRDLTGRLAALLIAHHDARGRRCTWLLDGTLIPLHDQSRTAVSKNYRRSVSIQVVARRCDRRIIAVSPAWPGNRNDIIVARHHPELLADPPRQVLSDGADRSLPGITPARDKTGRIIRDHTGRLHRRRRAAIEHVIAQLRDWQILRANADDPTTRSTTQSARSQRSTTTASTNCDSTVRRCAPTSMRSRCPRSRAPARTGRAAGTCRP
ncbi:hypothetical protein [Dactylosporangium darangshiense]